MAENKLNMRTSQVSKRQLATLCFPVAFLSFILTQNIRILNPRHVGWLWGSGDISSSFTQWIYFRKTPLVQWPLTVNPLYGSPWTRTIVFTDTPPLFALPFKYFLNQIDGLIQYTGLQILLSTFLLVLFSALCIEYLTHDWIYSLLGGFCISISPFLIFRDVIFHYSLNVMWVIPASIFLVLTRRINRFSWQWALLVFISLVWMPYFVVPVLLFWLPLFFYLLRLQQISKSIGLQSVVSIIFAGLIALVINGFWFNSSSSADYGFGYYNANLLSIINPITGGAALNWELSNNATWSILLPGFRNATDGQYEGFAFMGLGLTAVVILASILLIVNHQKLALLKSQYSQTLGLSSLLAFVFATGFSFDVGRIHLFTIGIPEVLRPMFGVFRSSGRFMLVVSFVLSISSLVLTRKFLSRWLAISIVLVAIFSTYLDSGHQIRINKRQQSVERPITPLTETVLEILDLYDIETVTFIPPENSAYEWKMAILAATAIRNVPVNDIFAARPNNPRLAEEREMVTDRFMSSTPRKNEMWVVYPEFASSQPSRLFRLGIDNCLIEVDSAFLIIRGNCQ